MRIEGLKVILFHCKACHLHAKVLAYEKVSYHLPLALSCHCAALCYVLAGELNVVRIFAGCYEHVLRAAKTFDSGDCIFANLCSNLLIFESAHTLLKCTLTHICWNKGAKSC